MEIWWRYKKTGGVRLEEKQKLKFNYGLTESQLFRYVKEARRRRGVTGLIFTQL
jgi:small subunit ribosomal protein S4